MGILEKQFTDIGDLIGLIKGGKIDLETARAILDGYKAQAKVLDQYGSFLVMAQNHKKLNRRVMKQLEKSNIIGEGEAFNISDNFELEMVKCPWFDSVISRAECLDNSGKKKNECNGCENKVITQDRLLGAK